MADKAEHQPWNGSRCETLKLPIVDAWHDFPLWTRWKKQKNSWAVPTQHWIHTHIMLHDFSCWISALLAMVCWYQNPSHSGKLGANLARQGLSDHARKQAQMFFFFLWKDSVFSLLLPVAFIAHIVQTTQLWLLHARSSLEVPFKLYYMWYIFIPRALPAVLVMAVVVLACALLSCWPQFDLLQWMIGRISSKLRNHFLKVQRCIVPSDYLIII